MHAFANDTTVETPVGVLFFASHTPTHVPPEAVRAVEAAGGHALTDEQAQSLTQHLADLAAAAKGTEVAQDEAKAEADRAAHAAAEQAAQAAAEQAAHSAAEAEAAAQAAAAAAATLHNDAPAGDTPAPQA